LPWVIQFNLKITSKYLLDLSNFLSLTYKKIMRSLLFVSSLLFPIISFSQGMETDRPDQTEASSTVEKKRLQIESGVLIEFVDKGEINSRSILLPTTLIRLGVSDHFELRILSQYENNEVFKAKNHGISDLELGTKIQLYQKENARFEMAFLSHLRIPTGTKSVRNENIGTLNKLCFSNKINDNFSIGYNLGYNYEGNNNGDGTYSMALNYSLSEKVAVYAEPYGEITNFERLMANFDSGFTYLLHENLQFDFSFGLGLNHDMNYLSFGLSWKSKE
jgi:hypothetical protein